MGGAPIEADTSPQKARLLTPKTEGAPQGALGGRLSAG